MVLYLVNQLTTFETVCTATGRKLCWFCLLWRLTATYSLSALLLWHLLNHIRHGFQGRYGILPTYDFFEWQISCTSPTLSFSMPAQSDIQYKYWKRSPLQNRKGLACETKPTVCKHKQKQMKLSLSNRELMVQRSPINKNKFQIADAHMVWAEKSSVKQFILLLRPYLQTCLVFKKVCIIVIYTM